MPPAIQQNELTEQIIGASIDVHRELGPGLLESAYEACLAYELAQRGMSVERQRSVPLVYKGLALDCGYRLDIVVERAVIIEVKAIDQLLPVHRAQVISYLRLTGLSVGLLINFHSPILRHGLQRVVNQYDGPTPSSFPSASSASSASPR